MRRTLPFAFAVLSCTAVSADEVYLKGGGRVSGRVLQRTATLVEIDVGAGKITVPAKQVERTWRAGVLSTSTTSARAPRPPTPPVGVNP